MTPDRASPTHMSTPHGLVTAAGRWYHISEEEVQAYAGPVLDHLSLEILLRWADAWVESPRTVAIWALPVLLWSLPVGWAAGVALGLYLGWALVSPAVTGLAAARVASWLQTVYGQGLYYVVALSGLAMKGDLPAMGVGLGAFLLLRWRIIDRGARAVLLPLQRRMYPLPIPDQVLRGLILRAALKYRVSVSQVDAMTAEILENWGARTDSNTASAPPSSTTQE